MEESQQFLATEKVGKLMRKYALPCVISLLVGALYNIVDQIFIANADYLGSYGNAANTVVFPLTVVALGIAVCFGDGCCAMVSGLLGSGRREEAKDAVGNTVLLTVHRRVRADGRVSDLRRRADYPFRRARQCGNLCAFPGILLLHLARHSVLPVRAGVKSGHPRRRKPEIRHDLHAGGRRGESDLGPVFIYGFRWGMMGAAVATVIGQVLTAALSVAYLCRPKSIRLDRTAFLPRARIIGRIVSLGLCSFLAQISLVAAMAAINNMLRKYGAQDPVFGQEQYAQIPMAVVGIVMKFFQIVISVVIGMAAGCIPIVGFNMGAQKPRRVQKLFTLLLCYEGILGAQNESVYYTDFAVRAFRIYLCMIVLACVNKATFIFLQAMGKAVESTLLSMVREIVFGVGFALLLPRFFGLSGVLWSMPVSDILTAVISAVIILKTYRQLRAAGRAAGREAGREAEREAERAQVVSG